jgi:hypothetical protein
VEALSQEDSQDQNQGGYNKASYREASRHSGGGGGGYNDKWQLVVSSRQAESQSKDGSGIYRGGRKKGREEREEAYITWPGKPA